MVKKFVIVGCGNIGSRHLQALTHLPYEFEVAIVEPNKNSRIMTINRLNEIRYDDKVDNITWFESISQLKSKSDLVIVSTSSVGRVDMINQLLENGHSRFLVEKIVCQSVEEYSSLLKNMEKFDAKGWVNTNRRYFESYQRIEQYFRNSKKLHLSVIASHPRLGTNAIHYIDLFSWLTKDYGIKLSGEFLLNKLFSNKRSENLVEFGGMIIGSIQNESSLMLNFLPDTSLPTIVNIVGDAGYLVIDETNNAIFDMTNHSNLDFVFEHASSLTTKIVKDILEKDACLLPTLIDSYESHCELFRIFNLHVKKMTNEDRVLCPIT